MKPDNQDFLLLRGLMREQRHWGEFKDLMQKRFPESRIITPDIPGNGKNYRSLSPNSIVEITDSLRHELNRITDLRQINIIALSMGGMSAIDWMCRYPEEIRSAVLINTSARSFSPFFQRLRWQSYLPVVLLIIQEPQRQENLILKLTSNLHTNDAELLRRWQSWRQQYPVSKKSAFNQLLASCAFKAKQQPVQPVLIVSSKADQLVDYRCSLALHRAWRTDYLEHPTAGHDLPLDDPDWLVEKIDVWLTNLQKADNCSNRS